jgi:small nuclear ribonucleoprotein (snRNP)-like protein
MVALRDGRKLIGVLRSWDQFGMAMSKGHTKQGMTED